jgi:hypothetical protein
MEQDKKQKKNYIGTWNNYPIGPSPDDARLAGISQRTGWGMLNHMYICEQTTFKYIIAGKEIGENGTPHLQMHFTLKRGMTMSALHKMLKNYEIKMSLLVPEGPSHTAHNIGYCKKDGDFKEWGTPNQQGKRNDLNEFMEEIKVNPKKRRIEIMEEFPMVYARYSKFANEYRLLKQTHEIIQGDLKECNQWIYGPPGTGKSRPFQEAGCFSKPANKWWDGYDGEEVVLIEDIDLTHDKLSHLLKIWLDRYPFYAEIKGATVKIRPAKIIITSNYRPDEIFRDEMLVEALERRFELVEKVAPLY